MALTVVPQDFDGLLVLILALEPLLSMGADARRSFRNRRQFEETRARQVTSTLLRIGTPSLLAALLGFLYFDNLSLYLSSTLDNDTLRILANDNANGQFVQNFLIVAGTLFAILAGNAYSNLYEQQERIFVSLYDEVTVAKLLLAHGAPPHLGARLRRRADGQVVVAPRGQAVLAGAVTH